MGGVLGRAARLETRGDVQWWHAPALAVHPDVVHGVTHSALGNFSLSADDDASAVQALLVLLMVLAATAMARGFGTL